MRESMGSTFKFSLGEAEEFIGTYG